MDLNETQRWLIQIVLAVIAFFTSAIVFVDFAPRLQPAINSRVIDRTRRLVALKLTVENASRAFVRHHPIHGTLIQVIPYGGSQQGTIGEFVPFTRDRADAIPALANRPWVEPDRAFRGTAYWYPGDRVTVERVIRLPDEDTILHVGLQVNGQVSWWVQAAMWAHGVRHLRRNGERWTTTAFVSLESSQPYDTQASPS